MKSSFPSAGAFARGVAALAFLCACVTCFAPGARAQAPAPEKFGKEELERGRRILKVVKAELKEKYYDPSFRGIDLDTVFEKADALMAKATSNNDLWGVIAQCLMLLDDSHTRFYPPLRVLYTDYGWEMQMIGDKCFVVGVDPGSDAEANKLAVGDQVLKLEGVAPARHNLSTLKYLFNSLRPQSGLRVVVRSPAGEERSLVVMAKVEKNLLIDSRDAYERDAAERRYKEYLREQRDRFHEVGSDVLVWKMRHFDDDKGEVDGYMKRARKFKSLVIDLRGNGGGYEATLKRLLGYFVEADTQIGELRRRAGTEPMLVKTRGDDRFKGRLLVLVDSRSASASELFAYVVQQTKRGTVIGDNTSGSVMRGRRYKYAVDAYYGLSITDADIVMSDGKRLEHAGVKPDVLMLPGADDLSKRRDPVLAHAVSLLGAQLTPEQAGAVFAADERKGR